MNYRSFACLAAALLAAGCEQPPVPLPRWNPDRAAADAIEALDKNADGAIDESELRQAPGLAVALPQVDADQSGSVSREELAARVRKYAQVELARVPFSCTLTLDGVPLEGADVTLAPEPFLGSLVPAATGKSGPQGITMLGVPDEVGGVSFGMYRVQVSKKDAAGQETIPAAYNAQTTLGQEIYIDVPTAERGAEFALQSSPASESSSR